MLKSKNFWLSLSIFIVILTVIFFPLFKGRVLLPLDILNQLYYPYAGEDLLGKINVFNHYTNDSIRFYYPAKMFLRGSIVNNSFPFWNHLVFGGYPFYANSMSGIFDLFNIFLIFFETHVACALETILQLLLAGITMYLLLKAYKISFAGSLLASIGYMLNGMFIYTLYHGWMLGAFCWVPLLMLILLKWVELRKIRYYVLACILMTVVHLGGSLQVSSYLFLFFGLYILYERFFLKRIDNKIFLKTMVIPVISLLLGATVLFPTLQSFFLDASGRTQGTREFHNFWHIVGAIPVLLVNLFNNALIGSVRGFEIIKLWGPGADDFNVSCGFSVAFFGLWAFLKNRNNRTVLFYLILALSAFLIPLLTPLYSFVYYRILILFIFAVCVASGFGFDSFFSEGSLENKIRYLKIFLVLMLLVMIGVFILQIAINLNYSRFEAYARDFVVGHLDKKFFGAHEGFYIGRVKNLLKHYSFTNPLVVISSFIILATIIIMFMAVTKKVSQRVAGAAICVLLSLEMISYAKSTITMVDTDQYPMYKNTGVTDQLREDKDVFRVFVNNAVYEYLPVFYPNVLMAYNIETTQGDDSYYPHSVKFFDINYIDLMNAKYVISRRYLEDTDKLTLIKDDVVRLYRNEHVMPRAFCVYNYEVVYGAEEQFEKLVESEFNYKRGALVSGELPFANFDKVSYNTYSSVDIVEYKANSVKIKVDTKRSSLLVVSNTFYPGWVARVNGLKTGIQRVNYCMQGLYVPEGSHVVELVFDPLIFNLASKVSLAIFIFLCLLFLNSKFSRNRKKY